MNAFVSTITQKGQVTIPKDVHDSLHIVTGDKVEFRGALYSQCTRENRH
jgi:AbrB family looped-hinge helix DNA binding protein